MADEPDNLVLNLLREMRDENRAFRAEMQGFHDETNGRLDAVEERLDTIEGQMHGMGGVIYTIYGKLMDQDERVAALELIRGEPAE